MAGVPQHKVNVGFSAPTAPSKAPSHPSGLDLTAAVSRHAALSTNVVAKAVPAATQHMPKLMGGTNLVASLARAAPMAAPVLSKLALPLTVAAAVKGAVDGGVQGYQKDGLAGAASGAAFGAADSITLGLASWAFEKAKKGMGFDARDQQQEVADGNAELLSHFSQANRSYVESKSKPAQSVPAKKPQTQQGGQRGWANPKVQAAAQAARGATYTGPS